MPTPQQQQPTAEKSVQTQDSTTLLVSNNSVSHFHPENTATEVANTLVSMATGRQRPTNVKQVNVVTVPAPTSLPILALADFTTSRGVPTAMALANQAKLSPVKHEEIVDGGADDDDDDDDDDASMSTDEYNSSRNDSTASSSKTPTKSARRKSGTKLTKKQKADAIQYGPIVVKPRKSTAPTLANGRRSKDEPLPPEEDCKRRQRRDRNKQAAAKCRRKRNDLREELETTERILLEEQKTLERSVHSLNEQKSQLEDLLRRFTSGRKTRLPISTNNAITLAKSDLKTIPTATLLDSTNNNGTSKRVTINFSNAQDLFNVASLNRLTSSSTTATTTDGSLAPSNAPMITIHIVPEVAQALLGSTTVDKAKLAELIQQANANNAASAASNTNNTSTNSTS